MASGYGCRLTGLVMWCRCTPAALSMMRLTALPQLTTPRCLDSAKQVLWCSQWDLVSIASAEGTCAAANATLLAGRRRMSVTQMLSWGALGVPLALSWGALRALLALSWGVPSASTWRFHRVSWSRRSFLFSWGGADIFGCRAAVV